MKIFVVGYPGEMGGANTECWHTVKLWRSAGWDVHLLPTWHAAASWLARLDAIGCVTHQTRPDDLERVPGLAGSPVVGFCNAEFLAHAHRFRAMGCPIVWANCMTFLFDHERKAFAEHGPANAFVFQSEFQRQQLEPQLAQFGYQPTSGYLIRGAFDVTEWAFNPRQHVKGDVFVVGRVARPDADKWSSNTWRIYERIAYRHRQALVLGVDEKTLAKIGAPPAWASILRPRAIPTQQFFAALHCLLPVNGGARENWPRAGLEAMAAGVPIVAQNEWGWREMVAHGETGFLGSCDEELAHYAATLAYDEELRLRVAHAARERLVNEFANPEVLLSAWAKLFESITSSRVVAA